MAGQPEEIQGFPLVRISRSTFTPELSDITVTEEDFVTVNNKNINELLKEEVIIEGEEDDYCENDDFQFSI